MLPSIYEVMGVDALHILVHSKLNAPGILEHPGPQHRELVPRINTMNVLGSASQGKSLVEPALLEINADISTRWVFKVHVRHSINEATQPRGLVHPLDLAPSHTPVNHAVRKSGS